MAYRQNYLDLDPTYTDAFGRPLLRMTFDFQDNEVKQMNGQADICVEHCQGNGSQARSIEASRRYPTRSCRIRAPTTREALSSGRIPTTSVLNKYLQVWDVPNVFVTGACVFPQNAGKNPTGPVGALAYWAADAIKNRYLKTPGPLVRA